MRGKQGGSEGGEMMMACLLIIIVYMAQYCNYWRKRKLPIDSNIIVDVSRLVGGRGRNGRHHGWGGSSTPLLNNQLFVGSGWK